MIFRKEDSIRRRWAQKRNITLGHLRGMQTRLRSLSTESVLTAPERRQAGMALLDISWLLEKWSDQNAASRANFEALEGDS